MDRKYLMKLQCALDLEIRKIEEREIRLIFEDARSLVSTAYILELGNDFKKNFIRIISLRSILESKFYGSNELQNNEKYNMLLIDETIGLGDHYADDEEIIIRRKKHDKIN